MLNQFDASKDLYQGQIQRLSCPVFMLAPTWLAMMAKKWIFEILVPWKITYSTPSLYYLMAGLPGAKALLSRVSALLFFLTALFIWRRFSNFVKRKIRKKVAEIHFVLDLITFFWLYPLQPPLTCLKSKLSYHIFGCICNKTCENFKLRISGSSILSS